MSETSASIGDSSVLPDAATVAVILNAGAARSLLASLTSGGFPPADVAKAVSLALVVSLNVVEGGDSADGTCVC
jgi:hypothetical protein